MTRHFAYTFVHCDDQGAIRQIGTSAVPFDVDGLRCVLVNITPEAFMGHAYTVDMTSLTTGENGWTYGVLVDGGKRRNTVNDIKALRNMELTSTDQYMVEDRPEDRNAWRQYRQGLRDLGTHQTVESMISAWPLRPDGVDAIAHLRN